MMKKAFLIAAALMAVFSPLYLLTHEPDAAAPEAVVVLSRYLKASYARDYKEAYRFISSKDQQLKPEAVYVRERGAFTGFTLVAARKLAEEITMKPAALTPVDERLKVKLTLKLPDAESVSELLHDWDEEKLNALPGPEQRKILTTLDELRRNGRMKMIEGVEEFALVKEDDGWRMALDWDAALRVSMAATVPPDGAIHAEPVPEQTVVKSSEPFRISYRVTNRSSNRLRTRIVHKVEPEGMAQYLDIVECALLLPTSMDPGEQAEYFTTYFVRGDLPENARSFKIIYDFKLVDS
jgi:hypothetical protein